MKGCILVPYRDRAEHLMQFIPHIRAYAPELDIYVIEQMDDLGFNRAKLLNIGFLETKGYDYHVSHDIDMLPIEADYSFCELPTHLAGKASQFGGKLPYNEYFGGVTLIPSEYFELINGFPNNLIGWGCEDDILYRSFIQKGVVPERKMCSFKSLSHSRDLDDAAYKRNVDLLNAGRDFTDGLSSCNYTCDHIQKDGFTLITARI